MNENKKKILIVDDSALNRSLLVDMLMDDYELLEAENGLEAIKILQERELEISLVLLDIVMPEMDGFEVLSVMNRKGWIKYIPVIMISAEVGGAYIDRAYNLGAIDYISRPFDERTVKHRVNCNYMLSMQQKELSEMLSKQVYEKEKDNSLMIEILSHIVEFRNGESGLHVLHVNYITNLLLEQIVKKTDKYPLTNSDIRLISQASALHDIGKISIPDAILNKPGRFTPEEFQVMKGHTVAGAEMLANIPFRRNEKLLQVAYEICRWHHERYDGRGYPDGLVGDAIPMSAQAVSMADVYDALTSKRVYKPAYDPETAVKMICNGECGAFNPLLIECLKELAPTLKTSLNVVSLGNEEEKRIYESVRQILSGDTSGLSERTIRLLEHERQKSQYLAEISGELIFEYTADPETIEFSELSSEVFKLPVSISEPSKNAEWKEIFPPSDFKAFKKMLSSASPENPVVNAKFLLNINGKKQWCKVTARAMWNGDDSMQFDGAIGKIVDVNDEIKAFELLEQRADHDNKTGLYNYGAAKTKIDALLAEGRRNYALIVFDLDDFKLANDKYGHLFGDEILCVVADRIRENIRSTDIASRMGGDEFIIFMEYRTSVQSQINRIFHCLTQSYKDFNIKVSMGIARTQDHPGCTSTELFEMADTAMYHVKHNEKKNGFCFYDPSMKI